MAGRGRKQKSYVTQSTFLISRYAAEIWNLTKRDVSRKESWNFQRIKKQTKYKTGHQTVSEARKQIKDKAWINHPVTKGGYIQ